MKIQNFLWAVALCNFLGGKGKTRPIIRRTPRAGQLRNLTCACNANRQRLHEGKPQLRVKDCCGTKHYTGEHVLHA